MPLLNKLFGKKSKPSFAPTYAGASAGKKATEGEAEQKKTAKSAVFSKSDILLGSLNTEKAMSGQNISHYVFRVAPSANKVEVSKAIGKEYNVKVISVNIINVPKKARQVGRTKGFRAGYKKAIVTLEKGQTIELK